MQWRAAAALAAINAAAVYVIVLWSKLYYWCMEGYVPAGWLIGSFALATVPPLAGNLVLILRSKRKRWITAVQAAAFIALFACEPFMMPHYNAWAAGYTMQLSCEPPAT